MPPADPGAKQDVEIAAGELKLQGSLNIPPGAKGLVLFAHGSGSGRHSPRNQAVAATLQRNGLGALLFDLLSPQEEEEDRETGHIRFDIPLLADRLNTARRWVGKQASWRDLPIGYFGASTGGGAALLAASKEPAHVAAVVSRGGRPDLVPAIALRTVKAATNFCNRTRRSASHFAPMQIAP